MVDFLNIVKYLFVFVMVYIALGIVLNDFWFKVLGGVALVAVLLYETFMPNDRSRRLLRRHVHVYRR